MESWLIYASIAGLFFFCGALSMHEKDQSRDIRRLERRLLRLEHPDLAHHLSTDVPGED